MRLTVQGNEIFYIWLEKKSNEIQEKLINQQALDNDDMFVLTIKAQTDRFHNMIIKFREEFKKSDKQFEQMYQQSGKRFVQESEEAEKRFEQWQESFDKRTEQSDIRFDFEKKVLICVGALIITLLIGICLK